jgi:hypothetical protein
MSEWVKCSEATPTETCKCWVLFDDGDLYIMTYVKGKGFRRNENINYKYGDAKPAYWQIIPYPEPPKD